MTRPDPAEHPSTAAHTLSDTTSDHSTRRRLLGAGLATALAAVVAGGRTATASPPQQPTAADVDLLVFAQGLELAVRDLYDAAIAAGADDPLFEVLSEQHEAYAQAIAGLTGSSANARNDEVFDALEADFAQSDTTAVALAAYDVESTAVATHTELLGLLEGVDAAKLVASILAIEARHCTVLADLGGQGDDLTALIDNSAEPVLPESAS